jgi:SAM-dependent methyltransferase
MSNHCYGQICGSTHRRTSERIRQWRRWLHRQPPGGAFAARRQRGTRRLFDNFTSGKRSHLDEVAGDRRLQIIEADSIEDALVRLKEEKFDVVMLISVLEHLSAPGVILESAREMLKPSGVLIVNVPTWRGKAFLEFSAFRLGLSPKVEMDDHKMYYDKRDLWPLLVRAGFKPSQIRLRYHKFGLNLLAAASK